MNIEEIEKHIIEMPDEVLSHIKFANPWQYDSGTVSSDEDGFTSYVSMDGKSDTNIKRESLQRECWNKFNANPQVNTAIRGIVGRLTGMGFNTSSEVKEIDDVIREILYDPRNRLYDNWTRYLVRTYIEGELFLPLTCHSDGFIEVDWIDPTNIKDDAIDGTGIIYHPNKANMPLFFNITDETDALVDQIPSINIARYPDLIKVARNNVTFDENLQKNSRSKSKKFSKVGGFYRFIVSWDKGFMTKRAASYLRTTLEWLNHYENLKKWEIDWKKSAGSYLWVFKITDPRSFKMWLALSDEDKRKTGIMAKKTPGGTLVLPPGMEVEVKNPTLTKITEQDTDILDMIASGLNESQDTLMGSNKATFASSKSNKGPASDRISDEIAYFDRFLKYDFWANIFYLKSSISNFPKSFKIREAVDFEKQKPVFKKVDRKPEELIDIHFPVSENIDLEARARALLGVKHSNVNATLGIPYSEMAKKMGIGGYGRLRLNAATEAEKYPELMIETDSVNDDESAQELIGSNKTPKKKNATDTTVKPKAKNENSTTK